MDDIALHYASEALVDSIVGAIGAAGIDLSDLTVDHLGPVDEFHIGGRAATEGLVERAGISAGSRVLDVGSGVGGTARFLAVNGLHSVTGVDLTPDYVETAGVLTDLVGLDGSVRFLQADVAELPLESSSFDAAVMLHVGMNIEDKASAFSEGYSLSTTSWARGMLRLSIHCRGRRLRQGAIWQRSTSMSKCWRPAASK